MAKSRLFEYAVILHKRKDSSKAQVEYEGAEIIINPTLILGKDEKEVVFKATRQIKEEHATNPDDIEIIVRNF